jgi:hypothetical protein
VAGGPVFVTDHAAQAGAGGGEVVFKFGDALAEGLVLGFGLGVLVGESLVVRGELVDALYEGLAVDLVELVAELEAGVLAELPRSSRSCRICWRASSRSVRRLAALAVRPVRSSLAGWAACCLIAFSTCSRTPAA